MRRFIFVLLLLPFLVLAQGLFSDRDLAFLGRGDATPFLASGPMWTPVVFEVDAANLTTYSTSAVSTKSNTLYLIYEYHRALNVAVMNSIAVSNSLGAVATFIRRTNFFQAVRSKQISVWAFMTNSDISAAAWNVTLSSAAQEGAILVVAWTNTAVGSAADSIAAIRQSAGFGLTTESWPNASNVLASALHDSGSSSFAMYAHKGTNPFGGSSNANSGIFEIYDVGVGVEGEWCGANTNWPTANRTNIVTSAAGTWATLGVEISSRWVSPPGVRVNPADSTVTAPNAASFTIFALGATNLLYQWQRTNVVDGFTNIPAATSDSYTLNPTAVGDSAAVFRCVVTNDYGSATSGVATLTVNP